MWPKKISIALSAGSLAALSALALAVPTEAARQGAQRIRINDDCDPATFNAAFGDGICVKKNGRTTVQAFLAELTATQQAAKWNFKPSMLKIKEGRPIILDNRGGETHTFTLVDHFGGGFIDGLNGLSGNPVPAAECAMTLPDGSLAPQPPSPVNVFVSAGTKEAFDTAGLKPGTYMFECCIHPWMRVVLTVR
jgi:plastocyanin